MNSLERNKQAEFDIHLATKYNLNENRQIQTGVHTFKNLLNPAELMANFKDPRKLGAALITIMIMLAIIVFLLFLFLPWLYYTIRGLQSHEELLLYGFPIGFGIIFFLLVIKMMATNIYKEISKGYSLIKNHNVQ
jgi:hypothetical protein